MSAGRSSAYTRTSSMTRQMPSTNNTSAVSSISRSIQTGSMNITPNNVRPRPISGLRQTSMDRANVLIRTIPTTIMPSAQRRITTDMTRSRLSSQDRSVSRDEYDALRRKARRHFRLPRTLKFLPRLAKHVEVNSFCPHSHLWDTLRSLKILSIQSLPLNSIKWVLFVKRDYF